MPKQRKNRFVAGQYFQWKIYPRTGFLRRWPIQQDQCRQAFPRYHRPGRSSDAALSVGPQEGNRIGAGRTKGYSSLYPVDIHRRWTRSLSDYCARPIVRGGVREGTLKRYRAACDKFRYSPASAAAPPGNKVDRALLDAYSRNLEKKKYADCTIYLELTFLKQSSNGWGGEEACVELSLPLPAQEDS